MYLSEYEIEERRCKRERGKQLVEQGLSTYQISERLGVSEKTANRWFHEFSGDSLDKSGDVQ